MQNKRSLIFLISFLFIGSTFCQSNTKIGRVKYSGGGDWYSSKTALKNLSTFCNIHLKTNIDTQEEIVFVGSTDIFYYPFLFLTGHGNIIFSEAEALNLREYLIGGGFLHICDNYGLDPYIRREMKKVFPELSFQLVPLNHSVYNKEFKFPQGLIKIHEHDAKPPLGFGLFWDGKLVCFYDYECDLGNGWEDAEVYNDSPEKRRKALEMGANLISYAFRGEN